MQRFFQCPRCGKTFQASTTQDQESRGRLCGACTEQAHVTVTSYQILKQAGLLEPDVMTIIADSTGPHLGTSLGPGVPPITDRDPGDEG